MARGDIIDGEIVPAPRVLTAEPSTSRPVEMRCDTHPAWLDCQLEQPECVAYAVRAEAVDERTWAERASTFRVVDRRRLSYPR